MRKNKYIKERNLLVFLSALGIFGDNISEKEVMRILNCSKAFLYYLRKYAIKNNLITVTLGVNGKVWHLNIEKIKEKLVSLGEKE